MNQCIICKRVCTIDTTTIQNAIIFECTSCGTFGMIDRIQGTFGDHEELLKLSHLLAEHKYKKGKNLLLSSTDDGLQDDFIVIDSYTLLKNYPKDALEMLDRTLLTLSRMIKHPSDKIRIKDESKEIFFSQDSQSIQYMIRQLAEQRFIATIESTGGDIDIDIESRGWQRIYELRKVPEGLQDQVFVAMWFDKNMNIYFENGIEKAVKDTTGYRAIKINGIEFNDKICDQIIAELKRSKFLIADFTGARAGVYFEAGYALGFGIPVIWTVEKKWVKKLHFDTRQYNHIVYSDVNELYNKLKARIEATIL